MQTGNPQPSVWRITTTDYWAFLALLCPIVWWGMTLALHFLGELPDLRRGRTITAQEGLAFFLILAGAATAAGLAILLWRIRRVQGIFERGIEVPGQIVRLGFYRDRGRAEYTYTHLGQTYHAGQALVRNGRTGNLALGGDVTLIVDAENPHRALIRDLFI